jgi:hypothetical protein
VNSNLYLVLKNIKILTNIQSINNYGDSGNNVT